MENYEGVGAQQASSPLWRFYLFRTKKKKKKKCLGRAERCKITQLEPASRTGRPPLHRSVHSAADAARTLTKPSSSIALIVTHTAPLAVLGWFEIGSEGHSQPVNTEEAFPAPQTVSQHHSLGPSARQKTGRRDPPTLTPRILNSARARLILEDAVCRSFPLAMTLTSRES